MRIILTGSTGFIGKNFLTLLKLKNIEVLTLNREILNNQIKLNNFIKSNFKRKKTFTVFVHLASEINSSPQIISINTRLTKKVLDLCVKHYIDRFIFASTHLVYGNTNYLPIDEEHPRNPTTYYGKSKLISENLCESYSKDFDLDVAILRITSVFGLGQNENYVIPRMFRDALSKQIILHKYSNGYQLMDLIHVNDVSQAILKSCKSKKSGIYNVASGIGITAFDLAKIISKLVGDCKISIENKKQITNHFLYDVSKIKNDMNFTIETKPTLKTLKPWFKTIR